MPIIIPDYAFNDSRLRPVELLTYAVVKQMAQETPDHGPTELWITQPRLAELLHVTQPTARRAINRLIEYGYISQRVFSTGRVIGILTPPTEEEA